jgi:hypothetical protein
MNNTLEPIKPELQKLVEDKGTQLPKTIAHVLSPIELGRIWVVHPTDNDPVLVSEKFGTVAIWFNF